MAAEMEYAARRPGPKACLSRPSLLRERVRRLPHGRAPAPAIPARDSWSATSVLYSQVIVPIMTRTVYVGRASSGERRAFMQAVQGGAAGGD